MRTSGILLPIFSLPSPYGIGCFSKEAYEFVDMLEAAGQSYWQILPLGPTSYGDSPYQSFSTYAGNPYFIDLEWLIQEGTITREECDVVDFGDAKQSIDYEKMYQFRYILLQKSFERSNVQETKEYQLFVEKNGYWLDDYAIFMAVKKHFGDVCWDQWPEEIRSRQIDAVNYFCEMLHSEIAFQKYLQFLFQKQWNHLKQYANNKGIGIIGDIPIYVSFDSADVWSDPKLFQLDENGTPIAVAGCPPDGFSATGQLWGNPLYDWQYHKEDGYDWWIARMEHCSKLYDVVRIDHFRGFDEYYSIPYGSETAKHGHWEKGPGLDLFKEMKRRLGTSQIIAEDLGFITDSVKDLVKHTGFPGMKVLEFAFDSREESDYLPHNYDKNCVVYTGTHDNETIVGWYENLAEPDLQMSIDYMDNADTVKEEIHWDFIRLAMQSVANICIIPVQDYLGLGNEARINKPSTLGNNWKWRMEQNQIEAKLVEKIRKLTIISGRRQVEL